MSRGVKSEVDDMSSSELLKLRDELEAQIDFGAMCRRACILMRPHKSEKESKKEKMSKKRKSLDRPKSAKAKMACGVGIAKRPHKPDEMKMKDTAVDAESKEDGVALPSGEGKGRKKVVTWRLSKELLEYLRTQEVVGYVATETPRPGLVRIPQDMFDQELKEEITAEFKENREFDAYVLFQYRTKGYAEIQEELTDDDEEEV